MAATLTVPCWPFHFAVIPIASSDKFVCRASDSYRQRSMCTLLPSTRTVVYTQFAQCPLRMSCLWPRCSQALIVPLSVRLLPQWLACRWRHFGFRLALCPCACDHILKVCELNTLSYEPFVGLHRIYNLRAVPGKDEPIRCRGQKAKGQGHNETMYGQKRHFGNFTVHAFKCHNLRQTLWWRDTGQRLAVEDHLDYYYSYATRSVHTLLSGFNC